MNNQEWKHLGMYLYIISHSFIMYELKCIFEIIQMKIIEPNNGEFE